MPEPAVDANLGDVARAADRWTAAFRQVTAEEPEVEGRLRAALGAGPSAELHEKARDLFTPVAREAHNAWRIVLKLGQTVEKLQREWVAEHRYTAPALDELLSALAEALATDPPGAAKSWLENVLDAADDGDVEAAARIASATLPWPEELNEGAAVLGDAFACWREDNRCPTLEPIVALADGRLSGWGTLVEAPELRSRLHRFAAWIALRGRGDANAARSHIDEAVKLYPFSGRMHAERAEFHLFVGDFPRAAIDAQQAIETEPSEPLGHLALGMWAELTGKFSGAEDLYRQGTELMPTVAIVRIPQSTALVDPTGRMLTVAAEELYRRFRFDAALVLLDEALLSGMRGSESHPEAVTYALRRRCLESLPEPALEEAAQAAMEAGRMCIWNGDLDCAIEELGRAVQLNGTEEAGWLLADAFVAKSFPLGAALPDREMVDEARSAWEGWAAKVGCPRDGTSWAYLTRAVIADLESQRPDADRRAGILEAVMFVEKGLMYDDTDAQRWGYAAQFLRYAGLGQLAFEADERGYALAASDRQVLAERLPLLASRRQFVEAEVVAQRLVTMFGEDPWVSAVRAWLAMHHRRDYEEALLLLELPLAEGNDHAWYRHMEALAHLGMGRRQEALEAFRRLREAPSLDGTSKCRLALASLALGDRDTGERALADAGSDPSTRRSTFLMTAAIAALAADEVDLAVHELQESIRLCTSKVQIDDVLFETVLMLRALTRGDDWARDTEAFVRGAVEETIAEQTTLLEQHPPGPDDELGKSLERLPAGGPLDTEYTALLAVAGRCYTAAGRAADAAPACESRRGAAVEPEATLGLERALTETAT